MTPAKVKSAVEERKHAIGDIIYTTNASEYDSPNYHLCDGSKIINDELFGIYKFAYGVSYQLSAPLDITAQLKQDSMTFFGYFVLKNGDVVVLYAPNQYSGGLVSGYRISISPFSISSITSSVSFTSDMRNGVGKVYLGEYNGKLYVRLNNYYYSNGKTVINQSFVCRLGTDNILSPISSFTVKYNNVVSVENDGIFYAVSVDSEYTVNVSSNPSSFSYATVYISAYDMKSDTAISNSAYARCNFSLSNVYQSSSSMFIIGRYGYLRISANTSYGGTIRNYDFRFDVISKTIVSSSVPSSLSNVLNKYAKFDGIAGCLHQWADEYELSFSSFEATQPTTVIKRPQSFSSLNLISFNDCLVLCRNTFGSLSIDEKSIINTVIGEFSNEYVFHTFYDNTAKYVNHTNRCILISYTNSYANYRAYIVTFSDSNVCLPKTETMTDPLSSMLKYIKIS